MQQVAQATPSPLERNLKVSVPVAQIEAEIATRLKQLARTVKMQGFRPGKVPLKMVERHYGFQVRQEVLSDKVQRSFEEAVKSQNYRVAGYPRFQPVTAANSAYRVAALNNSWLQPGSDAIRAACGPVLLVDDLADTGWTLTTAARVVRAAGAPEVLPFALASTS